MADPIVIVQPNNPTIIATPNIIVAPDATLTSRGVVQLSGDLAGTATVPQVTGTHLATPLPVAQGGTGSATANGALSNLGILAASGDLAGSYPNPSVVATHLAAPLPIAQGGTNASTQVGALASLGILTAQGDLTGTYPAPTVSKVTGVPVTGTPAYGQTIAANSPTGASWQILPGFFASTGVLSGGQMTINGTNPAAFDIVQTVGYITDYVSNPASPTITKVTIPAQTVAITGANANRAINWWVSDVNGVITSVGSSVPTPTQRRTSIMLGVTVGTVGTGVITSVNSTPATLIQPSNQHLDMMLAMGPFSISGNTISPNGTNLAFNKSAGTGFFPNYNAEIAPNDPSTVTNPAETAATFRYATQLSGSQAAPVSLIDPTRYDANGVITLVGGGTNQSTIQRVWLVGTGTAGAQLFVQYGQATYASLSAAQAAIGSTRYIVNPDFPGFATLIGWIVTIRTATNLSDPTQATFVLAGKFPTP